MSRPSLADAQRVLSLLQASGGGMSPFYVPFIRAALGLPHANIDFTRRLIGTVLWDNCVQRTRLVFAAAGVTAASLQWEGNYIGRYQQEALLELEGRLRHFHEWPAAPGAHGLGGSDAFAGALATLRAKARRVVEAHATGEMLSDEENV